MHRFAARIDTICSGVAAHGAQQACCNPPLANDNASNIAVATALAKLAVGESRSYTQLFVFAPATTGS